MPKPDSELQSCCHPQRRGKHVKYQLRRVNSNSIQTICIIPTTKSLDIVGDQKSAVIGVRYDSHQILVGLISMYTSPVGRWVVGVAAHGAMFVYKFKRVDESVFVNVKGPVIVTPCSKTDRVVVNPLPFT